VYYVCTLFRITYAFYNYLGGLVSVLGSFISMNVDLLIIVLFVGIKTFIEIILNAVDFFSFSVQTIKERTDN
jgi:hypothetical protein